MKIKYFFAAALLTATMTSAFAVVVLPANTTSTVSLTPSGGGDYSGNFGATHNSGNFTDTFNFTPSFGNRAIQSVLQTLGLTAASNIDFTSVSLNGHALTVIKNFAGSFVDYAFIAPTLTLSGPLQLVVSGKSFGASTSYVGGLTVVAAVPEAETYALMLAGLIFVGLMVKRRKVPTAFA